MADAQEEEVVKTADRLAALDTPTETPAEKVEKEPEQPTETETAEKPVQTPDEEVELPSDPKSAGKAFAEMRNKNKELEARLKEIEEQAAQKVETPTESQVEPLTFDIPPIYNQAPQGYDPSTGDFDPIAYRNAVLQEVRAEQARLNDEARQVAEAEAAYPQLKEGKEFDPDFYEATKALLLNSMVSGKKLTAKQAAEKVVGLSKKAQQQIASDAQEKQLEQIAQKEAASLEATGNSARGQGESSAAEYEYLREASKKSGREGDLARAERLAKLGM